MRVDVMEWIFKIIHPIIKDCKTPKEAEDKVKAWGQTVHPRDAFIGLMAVRFINSDWEQYNTLTPPAPGKN